MILVANTVRNRDFVMSVGQSNAAGLRDGNFATLWPSQVRSIQPSVMAADWLFTGAKYGVDPVWHQLTPRAVADTELGEPTGAKLGFGGMDLGRRLQGYGYAPAVASYGWGGTGAAWWATQTAVWLDWLHDRYDELVSPRRAALVVYQGENDAVTGDPWKVPWDGIMVEVRAIWPGCPVIVVRIPETWAAPHLDQLQAEQDAFVAADSNAAIVRDDAATFIDGTHLDPDSTGRIYRLAADAVAAKWSP